MRRKSDVGDRLYTTGEVAELLGIPASTQKEWDRRGYLLPAKRVGKHRRFDLTDLKRMVQVQILTERHRFRQRVLDAIAAGEGANAELPPALGGRPREQDDRSERERLIDLAARNAELFAQQRKLAKDLSVAEERYHRLVDQAPSGIIIAEPVSLKILDANSAAIDLYGYSKDELLGLTAEDLVTPEDMGVLLESRARIAAYERVSLELTNIDSTGRRFPTSVSIHQIEIGGSQVWSIILQDISARKMAELAIRDSERKLRSLLEGSNDGIVLISEDGLVLEWSPGQEAITGIERAEAIGQPAWDLHFRMTPTNRRNATRLGTMRDLLRQALKSGESPWFGRPIEAAVQRADGDLRHIQDMIFAIPTSKGYMVCSISRDITAQRMAQEELKRNEERFRSIFESAAVGMALVDQDGRIIRSNRSLENMLGYSAEELATRDVRSLTKAEDLHAESELSLQLRTGRRESYELEKRYLRGDGSYMWGRLTTYLITSVSDGSSLSIGMLQDITEQKNAESELDRVTQELVGTIEESANELRVVNERLAMETSRRSEVEAALRCSEARYRSLAGAVDAGVLIIGMDGQVLDANGKAEALLRVSLADMRAMDPNQPFWTVVRRDGMLLPPMEHPTTRSLHTGAVVTDEVLGIVERDRTVKWLIANSAPILDEESQSVTGAIVTLVEAPQPLPMFA